MRFTPRFLFSILLIASPFLTILAQEKLKIFFKVKNENSAKIKVCKLYISNLKIKKGNTVLFQEKDNAHLINPYDIKRNFIETDLPKNLTPNQIVIGIGIDSTMNFNGIKGGDLDPINGMYWAWNTGYINFKIEAENNESGNDEKLEYHIGGFLYPFYTYKEITLNLSAKKDSEIIVVIDIDTFLKEAVLLEKKSVLSPGASSVRLSELFSTCLKLQ